MLVSFTADSDEDLISVWDLIIYLFIYSLFYYNYYFFGGGGGRDTFFKCLPKSRIQMPASPENLSERGKGGGGVFYSSLG